MPANPGASAMPSPFLFLRAHGRPWTRSPLPQPSPKACTPGHWWCSCYSSRPHSSRSRGQRHLQTKRPWRVQQLRKQRGAWPTCPHWLQSLPIARHSDDAGCPAQTLTCPIVILAMLLHTTSECLPDWTLIVVTEAAESCLSSPMVDPHLDMAHDYQS